MIAVVKVHKTRLTCNGFGSWRMTAFLKLVLQVAGGLASYKLNVK